MKTQVSSSNQTTFPSTKLVSSKLLILDKDLQPQLPQTSNNPNRTQQLLNFFSRYRLRSKNFSLKKLRESRFLKLKEYKESVYFGEFINGKRQGKGILLYENNRVYEGDWESNFRHGTGFQRFSNGSVYEGTYINGKPHGIGKYTWPNGQFYDGQWQNGFREGKGMWKGAKGDQYVGQWKVGKADGYGVHKWISGDIYEGLFRSCLKHGKGIERFANGDLFKGYYVNGLPSGAGEYFWLNGSHFKGNFHNGLREGQGVWKRGNGNCDKYEGEYKKDEKSGEGVFTWSSGNVYKGSYQKDLRNGYGEMYWKNGSYYKGEWRNGIQHGEGVVYIPGDGLKKGIFQENTLMVLENEQRMTNKTRNLEIEQKQIPVSEKKLRKSIKKTITEETDNRQKQKTKNTLQNLTSTKKQKTKNTSHSYLIEKKQAHHRRLLPKQFYHKKELQDKYLTLDSTHTKTKSNLRKDRILHSSFYMHRLHQRPSTSPHKVSNEGASKEGLELLQIEGFNARKLHYSKTPK